MTLKVEAIYSEINLEVSISPALQSVLQDVKSFGDVNIRTGSYSLQLKAGRKDQAQYLVPNVPGIDKTHTILEGVTATDILLFKRNIYCTSNDSKVYCYKSNGELFWTFKHDDIYNPYGLTLVKEWLFVYSFLCKRRYRGCISGW